MKNECCNINEVVKEFYNYLKAYITKRVKDPSIADDLVQEVMVKLIESHQKQKEVQNIKAWLFQVSRNTIYDYYQKHKLEFSLTEDADLSEETDSEFSKILVSDYVIPMIEMLPEKYSKPLMWADIDKFSQKEIAEKLDLGLSATKMRVQRARTQLKDLFVECCHLEYDQQGNFMGCTIKESCEPLQNISKNLKDKTL